MTMPHRVQDGIDAAARARSTYTPNWHPILSAIEVEPGHWHMTAQYDRIYAVIRFLELGGERGYRAVTWAERSEDRGLIGYYRTLRAACMAAHQQSLRGIGHEFSGYPKHVYESGAISSGPSPLSGATS